MKKSIFIFPAILMISLLLMAFTNPKLMPINSNHALRIEQKNIFDYLTTDQIEAENRIALKQISPEGFKTIEQTLAKLSIEKKKKACVYFFNECRDIVNNYCKSSSNEQNNILSLKYQASFTHMEFINATKKTSCGIYVIYYECMTGQIICVVQSPYFWW